jgi:hypothetical protein
MTGCGGNETTCSRMSMSGRTLSMNGTSRLRPGSSVLWYLPRRSTTPALAWGMIRMDRASTVSTNTTRTMRSTITKTWPRLSIS